MFLGACIGFILGYTRGRTHKQYWDEKIEETIFTAGWQNGFLYTLDEHDQQFLDKVSPKATEHFLAWKGYPHNRRH